LIEHLHCSQRVLGTDEHSIHLLLSSVDVALEGALLVRIAPQGLIYSFQKVRKIFGLMLIYQSSSQT